MQTVLDQQVLEGTADGPNQVPTELMDVRGAESHRPANLGKLYHVPISALRGLLERRVPGVRVDDLRPDELIEEAANQPAITAADIEELYEDYRYGQRLSFYLYLLPSGLAPPTLEGIQTALDELTVADPPHLADEIIDDEYYEAERFANQIILQDEERFGEIREIRFRYFIIHRFLNVREEPDQVLQVRRGFFWLDLNLGYLVILSNDERLNGLLTRALSNCLQAVPLPVRFPKELVDKHLSIEKVKSVSHYDPGTGVRQSLSGQDLWQASEREILAREQRYVRPSSLYEEEVAVGVISGLGVTANKGKIYLTRALPASLVRTWAMQRLPELVRDLKHLKASQPGSFSLSLETINRIRLPKIGKAAIVTIVEALLQADREELTSVTLSQTALAIHDALAGKYFNPYLRIQCSQCEEVGELCPHCESRNLNLKESRITCKACGRTVFDGQSVALRCLNGHITSAPKEDAWSMAPNHWLQKRLVQVFDEIGHSWNEHADYFHVEGNTLHRLRRGQPLDGQLPQVVQTYINNFWDPVNGQVHAGTGDIIVDRSTVERGLPRSPDARGPERDPIVAVDRTYGCFDLRLRGNAVAGYTVEAHALNGGSVSPQPLMLPAGRTFQYQLDRVFHRATTGGEMRSVGKVLHDSLFPPQILKLWSHTVGGLRDEMGLRIRLHIGPAELMILPWELIYDEEYLGLRRRFPIVRYLDVPDPPKPFAVRPPLRVLVAMSQPTDLPPFAVEAELLNIRRTLEQLPDQIQVDVLESTQRQDLLARLRHDYHVLHYIGHGKFDGAEGHLVFEDPEGRADPVPALLLGQMVADSDLRLAVLNACETSLTGRSSDFWGVAHQLVKGGIPAVVAMQSTIPNHSAIAFSRGFYSALTHGWPVDTAVQEGRRAIMTALGGDWSGSVDWAIPTLHMRTPDGMILDIHDQPTGGER